MKEIWRTIPGTNGFMASNLGRIRNRDGVLRRQSVNIQGYHLVWIPVNGKMKNRRVHQLILEAFRRPKRPGEVCAHWNGIPGDNKLSNLRWATGKENASDKIRHGTAPREGRCSRTRLNRRQVLDIRKDARQHRLIADEYGINYGTVSKIKLRKAWAWLEEESMPVDVSENNPLVQATLARQDKNLAGFAMNGSTLKAIIRQLPCEAAGYDDAVLDRIVRSESPSDLMGVRVHVCQNIEDGVVLKMFHCIEKGSSK